MRFGFSTALQRWELQLQLLLLKLIIARVHTNAMTALVGQLRLTALQRGEALPCTENEFGSGSAVDDASEHLATSAKTLTACRTRGYKQDSMRVTLLGACSSRMCTPGVCVAVAGL